MSNRGGDGRHPADNGPTPFGSRSTVPTPPARPRSLTKLADGLRALGRTVIRASIDSFHRPREERYRRGADSPEGYYEDSFDNAALREALLDPLGPGGSRSFRRTAFDFRTDAPRVAPVEVASDSVVLLVDGVFLLRPELVDHWDFSVFLSVGFDEVLRRALDRDAALLGSRAEVERRYRSRYLPGQELHFAAANPQLRADVVIDNEDPANPHLERRPSARPGGPHLV